MALVRPSFLSQICTVCHECNIQNHSKGPCTYLLDCSFFFFNEISFRKRLLHTPYRVKEFEAMEGKMSGLKSLLASVDSLQMRDKTRKRFSSHRGVSCRQYCHSWHDTALEPCSRNLCSQVLMELALKGRWFYSPQSGEGMVASIFAFTKSFLIFL